METPKFVMSGTLLLAAFFVGMGCAEKSKDGKAELAPKAPAQKVLSEKTLQGSWQLISFQNKDKELVKADGEGFLPHQNREDLDGKPIKRKILQSFDGALQTMTEITPELGKSSESRHKYKFEKEKEIFVITTEQRELEGQGTRPLTIEVKLTADDILELHFINDIRDQKPIAQYKRLLDLDLQKISMPPKGLQQFVQLNRKVSSDGKAGDLQKLEIKSNVAGRIKCSIREDKFFDLVAQESGTGSQRFIKMTVDVSGSEIQEIKKTGSDAPLKELTYRNYVEGNLLDGKLTEGDCKIKIYRQDRWFVAGQIACNKSGSTGAAAVTMGQKTDAEELNGTFACATTRMKKGEENSADE